MPKKICLHCMFIDSVKFKYRKWAKAGEKPHAHDDMVKRDIFASLARLSYELMNQLSEDERNKFITLIQIRHASAIPPEMTEIFSKLMGGENQTKQ